MNADNTLSIRWYKLSICDWNVLCTLLVRYAYVQLVMNMTKTGKKTSIVQRTPTYEKFAEPSWHMSNTLWVSFVYVKSTVAYVVIRRVRREIFNMLKISRRTRRMTTYASVLLMYTKLTHNVFDMCQLGSANFSYVCICWIKRQGVTVASHFDV